MPATQWLQRLRRLTGAQAPSSQQIAVYVSGSAVGCARLHVLAASPKSMQIDMRVDRLPHLTELKSVLSEQASQLSLNSSPARHSCNLVMAPETYNLALLERPDVADEELVDAVRWLMADQVDYPVEQAALDVFHLPASAARERPMVFVASMQKEFLASVVAEIAAAGLTAATVDISELALRNLSWQCFPSPDQNVALLRMTANSGLINISRGDELYLSRRVSGMPEEFSEHHWTDFQERLLLQVQRSIDYYESAMGQPHCDALLVACTDGWTERVTDYLAEMLPIPVRSFFSVFGAEIELTLHNPDSQRVDFDHPLDTQVNAICAGLPALGGVLRRHIDEHMAEVA